MNNAESLFESAKHFFPEIKNKVIVSYSVTNLFNAIKDHYESLHHDIVTDLKEKFLERGYLKTLSGRMLYVIENNDYFGFLTEQSFYDIYNMIQHKFNCLTNTSIQYNICSSEDVEKLIKECQEIIDSFKLKVPYKIKFEVTYENQYA